MLAQSMGPQTPKESDPLLTELKATVPTEDEQVSRVGLKTGPEAQL